MKRPGEISICCILFLAVFWGTAHSAVQSSANFFIDVDVVSGGGRDAESASYRAMHTTGQSSAIGYSDSGSYRNYGGFWNGMALYDGDSDGSGRLADCDDMDATEQPGQTWYADVDGDGYSDGSLTVQCLRPADCYVASELTATTGDCDDGDAQELPGQKWYTDADSDSYGNKLASAVTQCLRPVGRVPDNTDCDDTDSEVNPGKNERPRSSPMCSDSKDNDCDGFIDLADRGCMTAGLPWIPILLE